MVHFMQWILPFVPKKKVKKRNVLGQFARLFHNTRSQGTTHKTTDCLVPNYEWLVGISFWVAKI
jgi:hypothetical protein